LAALLVALLTGACTKKFNQQVADAVRHFDHADLPSGQVEVLRTEVAGDHALAEIKVRTAVKLTKKKGRWVVEEFRLGDRRWEKADTFATALDASRMDTTRSLLRLVAGGLQRYVSARRELPPVRRYEELIEILVPNYLAEVVRLDGWSNPLIYRRLSNDAFELRSAGPDGEPDTGDDVVERSPQ
jgi:hypothetical protein